MLYLGTFGLECEKAIVIPDISTLDILKNESLTHIVNFGIGCGFSKDPEYSFSEGLDPGPRLLL